MGNLTNQLKDRFTTATSGLIGTQVVVDDDIVFVRTLSRISDQVVVMAQATGDGCIEITYAQPGCSAKLLGKIIKSVATKSMELPGTQIDLAEVPDYELDDRVPVPTL